MSKEINEYEKGYLEGISDYKDKKYLEIETKSSLREYRTSKLIKHFNMIKNDYFNEIYLDGEHWHLVMIAEDGFTLRINLNIGE